MGIFDNEDVQGMGYGCRPYEPKEQDLDEPEYVEPCEMSEENHADWVNDELKLQPKPEYDAKYEAYLKEEMRNAEENL